MFSDRNNTNYLQYHPLLYNRDPRPEIASLPAN